MVGTIVGGDVDGTAHPDFESVALVDDTGMQVAKASTKSWTTSRITVA